MRLIRYAGAATAALVVIAAAAIYLTLRSSLPQLSGEIVAPATALRGRASIERDVNGTPTIRAASRADLAFATGFTHAQDRFFQMDLMRRAAAGELAELLGGAMLDDDKRFRVHGFRQVALQVVADASQADRAIIESYVAGVNTGLSALRARPWEYALLRSRPAAWTAEDSVLVAFSMYLSLNDSTGQAEMARAALHEALPAPMFAFLQPYGTSWDAPLTGSPWSSPPTPGPDVFDLRKNAIAQLSSRGRPSRQLIDAPDADVVGSNSWAVAGTHTASGAALLANDMHLALRLPNTWYRARMMVVSSTQPSLDLVGVTLPGVPMLIVGSNGHVAWGFTNSYGDWTDVVLVDQAPGKSDSYLITDGAEAYHVRQETILVRDSDPVRLDVRTTRWGPVIGEDASGRSLVLAWTAHHARGSNLQLLHFETAQNLAQALDVANRSGGPVQNFVAADSTGRIGWTLMGQVPVRANYDSSRPASWQSSSTGWIGWRTPEEYPRVIDPANGRLWTANARTIDAQSWLEFLGDGGYDLGARANQIRDDLLALNAATAADMHNIQMDDRALFLTRWHDLLLSVLTTDVVKGNERRQQAQSLVSNWSGHAAVDDAGYRIVRAFRHRVRDDVYASLVTEASRKNPAMKFVPSPQFEGPLWQMLSEQPAHLLPPQFSNWNAALLHSLDASLGSLLKECDSLSTCTWGQQNTLAMQHPLSAALPGLSRWLDMPREALPGDAAMPRVQGPSFGASERMVVSPGREAEGLLQMPGGPVDHPLSPFYGAGHAAWSHGEAVPLLPGKTVYKLELVPG